MTDVDPPAIITQKEKTKIMLEPFSKGQQQQLVGAYSQVMAPCLASESPTGLVTREAHCTSARGSEAGAEGLRAGTHFGGVVVSPGGLCRLTGVCSADPLPLLPEADSAPLHGRGTM